MESPKQSRRDSIDQQEEGKSNIEENVIDIIIVDFNGKEIPIRVVSYETVLELREYLSDNVYTFLFTNYFLEHKGTRLGDYQELTSVDLASHPRINMRPCLYDDKAMQAHITKLQNTLITPPVLTLNVAPLQEAKKGEEQKDPNDGQSKRLYHDFADLIKAAKPPAERPEPEFHPPVAMGQHASTSYDSLFSGAIQTSPLNKIEQVKCIEGIIFSSVTVTPDRRMLGDLMYLTVRTLEQPNFEQGITCTVNGFYRNDSAISSFLPGPSARNPCFSYTIAGCLHQLSPAFSEKLQVYLSSILKCEAYFLSQPIAKPDSFWLVPQEEVEAENKLKASFGRPPEAELHGFELSNPRDWNEEYQVVKAFPTDQLPQKIQRERALHKIYSDFVDAATKGAVAIVNKKLTALNPAEPQRLQVFVYNQIFFSYATDQGPDQVYADLTKVETSLSYVQVNHDLTGLRLLQSVADVDKLHNLATCVVFYKGHRLICQTIVPGILNNNDLSKLAEYGPVEERKNYKITEEFHGLMCQVADSLSIKTCKVMDPGSGTAVEIAGSADCRGIRGTDRRCYLVEMQGLLPRDSNLKGDNFQTALVRPELVSLFQQARTLDYVSEKIKPFQEQLAKERPPLPKMGGELTQDQKQMLIDQDKAENIKKITEIGRLMQEAPKLKFNVNVFRNNVQLDMPEEEIKADEDLVEELAAFLKNNSIRTLIHSMKQIDGTPNDSQSVEAIFHQHGVNMRYLGHVINELKTQKAASQKSQKQELEFLQFKGDFHHLLVILEKEVYLRSAKHVINEILREQCDQSDLYLSEVIAHLLNCMLAPFPQQEKMDEGIIKFEDDSLQNNFAFFPEETFGIRSRSSSFVEENPEKITPAKAKEESKPEEKPETVEGKSKKALRRQKQKQKKQQEKGNQQSEQREDQAKPLKTMEEILFQLQRPADETFSVNELFQTPILSTGLNRVTPPGVLAITPGRLYAQICEQAKQRFHTYELPADHTRVKCLQSPPLKSALLRDICKAVGIQLFSRDGKKEFCLTNNLKQLVEHYSDTFQKEKPLQQKKKGGKAEEVKALGEEEILARYQYLPFSPDDISKLFPVLKTTRELKGNGSLEIKKLVQNGQAAVREGQLEIAFDQFSQAINLSMQIYGPMNTEIASCIKRLGTLQSKFGDYLQAIEMQTKAIVLNERLAGRDTPEVAENYSCLAIYYHTCGLSDRAFQYMYQALNILEVSVGDMHPSIANIWQNLAQMYCEVQQFAKMQSCMKQSLAINKQLYGKDHIQVANTYSVFAQLCFSSQELRGSVENQEKAYQILQKLVPTSSEMLKETKSKLDLFLKHCVTFEKNKQQQRSIGSNKAPNMPQMQSQKEPAELQQDIVDKYLKRMKGVANNPRKAAENNPLDYLEYQAMRERQAAAQRYVHQGKDQDLKDAVEEKNDSASKLDFKKDHTLEKLAVVLKDIDLEFLCIYTRSLMMMKKMKDEGTWQEVLMIRYRQRVEEETAVAAKSILSRHGLPNLTLTNLEDWATHFATSQLVKDHVATTDKLQSDVFDKFTISYVDFNLPKKFSPECYLQIYAKLCETLRHVLWKDLLLNKESGQDADFPTVLKRVNAKFEAVRFDSFQLILNEGPVESQEFARVTMQRAYASHAIKLGVKWVDQVEMITTRHNKLIAEFESEKFYDQIEVDPRGMRELVMKEPESQQSVQKPAKSGYLAKFKARKQQKEAESTSTSATQEK